MGWDGMGSWGPAGAGGYWGELLESMGGFSFPLVSVCVEGGGREV